MQIKQINPEFAVSEQIHISDIQRLKQAGFQSIICNRPDAEESDQIAFAEIEREAERQGISCAFLPVISGKVSQESAIEFAKLLTNLPQPCLAYCRSGTRSITLWALSQAANLPFSTLLNTAKQAGYDLSGIAHHLLNAGQMSASKAEHSHAVVIVGAGAAGIAVASSLKSRAPDLDIAIIDPADVHYYQPGWTMVGGGIFESKDTVRTTASVMPAGIKWIKAAATTFIPTDNLVLLDEYRQVKYEQLIVCPGVKLDWGSIAGLTDTLGKNGVTSNYRFDLAPYTWELVKSLKSGKAIFTQPPMPIKCAGAPQKAMYLSGDYWLNQGSLNNIDIEFFNAGKVLFGVKEYVPELLKYVEKYQANLNFSLQLVAINGERKIAQFKDLENESSPLVEKEFDMIHVVPPQHAPEFIRNSPLVDEAGWVDVQQTTLQHKKYKNIYGLGDVINAPNAKTAAAARMQAPVVAANLLHERGLYPHKATYNGYGSCPLTVEKGKIILAEFGYGGTLLSSFPSWLIQGTKPSRLAWLLKAKVLPQLYWNGMLKGREWMAKPELERS